MASALIGKRIAILVDDGFEQTGLTEPLGALLTAGAHATLVSPRRGAVRSWDASEWGESFPVDLELRLAEEADFDALLLPGGVMNTDLLRTNDDALRFIQAFANAAKPIAAICHGPQVLIDAGIIRGRTVTSFPSIRRDLINAGAEWLDEPAIVHQGLITSRSLADVAYFNQAMVDEFASTGWTASHQHFFSRCGIHIAALGSSEMTGLLDEIADSTAISAFVVARGSIQVIHTAGEDKPPGGAKALRSSRMTGRDHHCGNRA